MFGDIFVRRNFKPLPPKDEALSLLKDYFENFNCMFPLFHEPTFMHLVDLRYSRNHYDGSGWWASLNVALAIAHRLRVMSNLVPHEEDQSAWGYLKNALGVVTELTMRNTDLLSVQALLGMVRAAHSSIFPFSMAQATDPFPPGTLPPRNSQLTAVLLPGRGSHPALPQHRSSQAWFRLQPATGRD